MTVESTSMSDDSRLAKRAANNGTARADRLGSDRSQTENRESNDKVRASERRAMLRDTNTLLPNPPQMEGYHCVWLTTTNQKDSIEHRQRLGYQLVKRSELPDFALNSQKSGELTDDRIMINEMVLAKIDIDDWKADMIDMHHTQPIEEISKLKNSVHTMQDGRGRSIGYTGGDFNSGVSDGYASLGKTKAPTLNGVY